mmetsp:Transcript_77353/g.215003  ORF Transcript_77353/g.215003 Transcript_77353/m.215003 type:complete len:248 (-) Transcript_77353:935-1678(-)
MGCGFNLGGGCQPWKRRWFQRDCAPFRVARRQPSFRTRTAQRRRRLGHWPRGLECEVCVAEAVLPRQPSRRPRGCRVAGPGHTRGQDDMVCGGFVVRRHDHDLRGRRSPCGRGFRQQCRHRVAIRRQGHAIEPLSFHHGESGEGEQRDRRGPGRQHARCQQLWLERARVQQPWRVHGLEHGGGHDRRGVVTQDDEKRRWLEPPGRHRHCFGRGDAGSCTEPRANVWALFCELLSGDLQWQLFEHGPR